MKLRRQKRELLQLEEKRQDWTVHLNNKKLSKKEKCMRIKEKAREIEEQALRKEQIINIKGGTLGTTIDVSKMNNLS